MSGIKTFPSLLGALSPVGGLSGKLSIPDRIQNETYTGSCEVVPNAFNAQTLLTANKLLAKDIVVRKVPYYENSNPQNGITVYIAEGGNSNANA